MGTVVVEGVEVSSIASVVCGINGVGTVVVFVNVSCEIEGDSERNIADSVMASELSEP